MSMESLREVISPEAERALEIYLGLIRKWNPAINLVSPKTLDMIWDRHFLDSAQIFVASRCSGGHWVDLGSGAGFPGMVISVLLKEAGLPAHMTLIESDQRKAVFLSTVVRELDLPCTVLVERIETASPQKADWVTARALAPLDKLLDFSARHLGLSGSALLPKGRTYQVEVDAARERWAFALETIPSLCDPESVVLRISDLVQKD